MSVEGFILLGLYVSFFVATIDGESVKISVGITVPSSGLSDGVDETIAIVGDDDDDDDDNDEGASVDIVVLISTDGASVSAITGDEDVESKDIAVLGVEEGSLVVISVVGFNDGDSEVAVDGKFVEAAVVTDDVLGISDGGWFVTTDTKVDGTSDITTTVGSNDGDSEVTVDGEAVGMIGDPLAIATLGSSEGNDGRVPAKIGKAVGDPEVNDILLGLREGISVETTDGVLVGASVDTPILVDGASTLSALAMLG